MSANELSESTKKLITQYILAQKQETEKPTLICCKTIIGFGAPNKQGSEDAHGAPLGVAEIAAAREFLGWPHAPFVIPADVYSAWDAKPAGAVAEGNSQVLQRDGVADDEEV